MGIAKQDSIKIHMRDKVVQIYFMHVQIFYINQLLMNQSLFMKREEPNHWRQYGFQEATPVHEQIWDQCAHEATRMDCAGSVVRILLINNQLLTKQNGNPLRYAVLDVNFEFEIVHSIPDDPATPMRGFYLHYRPQNTRMAFFNNDQEVVGKWITGFKKLIIHFSDKFNKYFTQIRKIYNTNDVKVYQGVYINDRKLEKFAIKNQSNIKLSQNNFKGWNQVRNEIQNLKNLNHPNIVKFHQACQSNTSFYIVNHFVQGLSLAKFNFQYSKEFQYQNVKLIAQGVLEGLAYMHRLNLVHRDIKSANIMLDATQNCKPIIIDLGYSEFAHSANLVNSICGTPGYFAPQCFIEASKGHSTRIYTKSDVFSFGICLYETLFGFNPFIPRSRSQNITPEEAQKINMECDIIYPRLFCPGQRKLQLLDLIKKMVVKNHQARISADQALEHPFFQEIEAQECREPNNNNGMMTRKRTKMIKKGDKKRKE